MLHLQLKPQLFLLRPAAFRPFQQGTSLAMAAQTVRGEAQDNVIVVEEAVILMGIGQMQEALVSLILGICQVPDSDPATVTLWNKKPYFVFTAKRTIISKKSVLLGLKTIHLVSDMTALPIILNK